MKIFYVIREGWNSANQPSMGTKQNPRDKFESNQYDLVAIVEAENEDQACKQYTGSVYNNQRLFATSNLRSIKGLTREAKQLNDEVERVTNRRKGRG